MADSLLCTVICAQAFAERPLLFHLSFDDGLEGVASDGRFIKPAASGKVKFVDGFKGTGLAFEEGGFLSFPTRGIFPLGSGSIEMYVKPLFPPGGGKFRTFFAAHGSAYNINSFQMDRGSHPSFGFAIHGHDKCGVSVSCDDALLKQNQWTHVRGRWDLKKKSIALYVNGLKVDSRDCPSIDVRSVGDTIYFGSCPGADERGCMSVLDEINIYGGEE